MNLGLYIYMTLKLNSLECTTIRKKKYKTYKSIR